MNCSLQKYFKVICDFMNIDQKTNQEEFLNSFQNITTFKDFLVYLDNIKLDIVPSFIQRIPIGHSKLQPKKIISFSNLIKSKKLNYYYIWQWKIKYRRLFSIITSLIISLVFFYISYITFISYFNSIYIKYLFCIDYFILTYNATSSFFKMLIGNFIAFKDKQYCQFSCAKTYKKDTKIAIVYPVFHEDTTRFIASIMAIWRELEQIESVSKHYEFYVLSDSRFFINRIQEEISIILAKQKLKNIKLYYRWRSINQNAKLGNVIDFLRRYSKRYKYMVVMDADSIMSGNAIHKIVGIAENHERIGIIQTNPRPILCNSIFGRIMQFANWAYGDFFFHAIKHYYLGDAFYVGHNALLRLKYFRDACILPKLSGIPPWGGKPLSHDLVEAALMAKSGYEIWFLPEIAGSFEEIPSNIIDYLIRERRWMQGNLQNSRVALGFELKNAHRDLLISGMMSYFVSILWFVLILISVIANINFNMNDYQINFFHLKVNSIYMLYYITILLFFPKILSIFQIIFQKKFKQFGGIFCFLISCILEQVFSVFLAPIIMIFIIKFFIMWIKSLPVKWGTQNRNNDILSWKICLNQFSFPVISGLIIFIIIKFNDFNLIWEYNDFYSFFIPEITWKNHYLWFFPIFIPLIISPLIARLTSFIVKSNRFWKLFRTPEETQPSNIIYLTKKYQFYLKNNLPIFNNETQALHYAYTDPAFFIYHYHFLFNRQKYLDLQKSEKDNILYNNDKLKKAFYHKKNFIYYHNMMTYLK